MTRKLRTALIAVLLLGLVAGGAGAAAAEDINNEVDNEETTIVNDNDLVDVDETANNISTNVLGVQADDSPVTVLALL
jgi:glucose dehydrogenase